jgi:uncharacterized protein (DUF2235 family)
MGYLVGRAQKELDMAKKIVLCADGTWNSPHGVGAMPLDTNVRKIYCALKDDPAQLRYYDSGVGTDGTPIDHYTGGAMGEGLFQKVKDGYGFLAAVWDPGDSIYIFGFSRGAYTARSISGMLAKFGVPDKNFDNMTVSKIFEAYRETDPVQKAAAKAALTAEYALTDVDIAMVGVWDTVGSLGIPGLLFGTFDQGRFGFLDTSLHPNVQKACHAICIDERRAQFAPTLWTNADGSPRPNDKQLQQVWFAGVHCDVGGSYAEHGLSDITLCWMMRRAEECGLSFSDAAKAEYCTLNARMAASQAHDEWKIVPWGFPKSRVIPSGAVISDSVGLRLAGVPEYKPEPLAPKFSIEGYLVEKVLAI